MDEQKRPPKNMEFQKDINLIPTCLLIIESFFTFFWLVWWQRDGEGDVVFFKFSFAMEKKFTIEDAWETEECLRQLKKQQLKKRRRQRNKVLVKETTIVAPPPVKIHEKMLCCLFKQRVPQMLEKMV